MMTRILIITTILLLVVGCKNSTDEGDHKPFEEGSIPSAKDISNLCPLEINNSESGGKLALIVGIGKYKTKIPPLRGPVQDATQIYTLLTRAENKGGYGFQKQDVCMLLNETATVSNFKAAFEKALIKSAAKAESIVIYFAGYGSQIRDNDDDEVGEWDQTIILFDSRTNGIHDLSDDEFSELMSRLYAKNKNISVIMDAGFSGITTRSNLGNVRYYEAEKDYERKDINQSDGSTGFVAEDLPGVVILGAAIEGSTAIEVEDNGIYRGAFTSALVTALTQTSTAPITYAQVSRQVPQWLATVSSQIPYFSGDLSRAVFANSKRTRPLGWDVDKIQPNGDVILAGPPLPGMGVGAEMRIYSGSVTSDKVNNPGNAKATVVISKLNEINAIAKTMSLNSSADKIQAGDIAVLVRPSDNSIKLRVRIRTSGTGAIPSSIRKAIQEAISKHSQANMLVNIVDNQDDLELSKDASGNYVLRGEEGRIRNQFDSQSELLKNIPVVLWRHAKQRALLSLRGEGGKDFVDQETLKIRIVPTKKQPKCAKDVWEQAIPNQLQLIPLCHEWQIEVEVDPKAKKPVLVGGLILGNSGDMAGFPAAGSTSNVLQPGEKITFTKIYRATPPIGSREYIMVFATQKSNPVPWGLLTDIESDKRALQAGKGPLHSALDRFFKPGTRSSAALSKQMEDSTWTLSTLPFEVVANLEFWKPSASHKKREYTIPNFDIRPYLVEDKNSALYKVLMKADELAHASVKDGYPYKQHAWSKATDKENLEYGIDCSRAIWYVFTRSGLPYNRENKYLSTSMMVDKNSWMNDKFMRCDDDPNLRIGDVLVYRDATRNQGHVVVVIDPVKRIAWGSHGWDGVAKESNYKIPADTGVEYQIIKYKTNMKAWDRTTMVRSACYRYRQFDEEKKAGSLQPVSLIKMDPCNSQTCTIAK